MTIMRASRFLSAFAFAVLLAACGAESGKAGSAGNDCYGNNTCDEGLTCREGVCLTVSTTTGTGGHGGHGGQAGTTSSTLVGGSGGSAGKGGAGTTTTAANSPPQIVVLGTNVASITEGESATFTAVVTDPDGVDDVIGGTLRDPGGAIYGAFVTSSQEGAYQLILSWDDLHQVLPIQFDEGESPTREFVASFYDQAAHTVEKSISLTLSCKGHGACGGACKDMSADVKNCKSCGVTCAVGASCSQGSCICPAGGGVCNGVCKDLQNDEANCGDCGVACAAGTLCMGGKCGVLSACYNGQSGGGSPPPQTTCAALCAASGKVCQDACKGLTSNFPIGAVVYHAATCSTTVATNDLFCGGTFAKAYGAKCCCP